jgi:hypothetical protein
MRKFLALPALGAALAAAVLVTPSAVSAAPTPKATGGIQLASPMQYVEFNAFDYGAPARDRGTVKYANFEYLSPGSGVWSILGTYPLVFSYNGDVVHSMTVTSINPVSTTSTQFSGTGFWTGDPARTWTISGLVSGSNISFDIVYTGNYVPYSLHADGTINPDGSMSGTSLETVTPDPLTPPLTLPWTVPAGSVHEVLSYSAPVNCATVNGATAAFSFAIPSNQPVGLANLPVRFTMTDGGSPAAGHDGWWQAVTTGCLPDSSGSSATIVGGNLVVHH